MTAIKRASVYKFLKKEKFLVHCISSLQMGGGIASEPFVWLEGNTTLNKVVEQIIYVLDKSKTGLSMPTDWKQCEKAFINSIGLKKQSDLYKDSIHVSVFIKDGILFFTPMKNLGSKGFINVFNNRIEVAENAGVDIITKAFEEALNKCV